MHRVFGYDKHALLLPRPVAVNADIPMQHELLLEGNVTLDAKVGPLSVRRLLFAHQLDAQPPQPQSAELGDIDQRPFARAQWMITHLHYRRSQPCRTTQQAEKMAIEP